MSRHSAVPNEPSPNIGHSYRAWSQALPTIAPAKQPPENRARKDALSAAAALSGERGCRPFPRTPFPAQSLGYAEAAIGIRLLQASARVTVTYTGAPTAVILAQRNTGQDARGMPLPSTAYTDGRLTSVTDAMAQITRYAYDTTAHSTTITYPDLTTATLVYDAYGMLLTSTDALLQTTTNEYNPDHTLKSVTDPLGHKTSYEYDTNGNRTKVTNPGLPPSQTLYNAYSEPVTTTDEKGNIRTFTYDAHFWPQLATDRPGGSTDTLHPVVSFTFNTNGTMASKAVGYDLTQTPSAAIQYTYDTYGNLAGETDAVGRLTTYFYDNP